MKKKNYSQYLYFLRFIKKKIKFKSIATYTLFLGILTILIILYLVSLYIVDLIYDTETGFIINRTVLSFLIFLPFSLLIFLLVTAVRMFFNRIKKGSQVRFKLLNYFFISTILPSLLYITLLSHFLDEAVNVFFKPEVIHSIEKSLPPVKKKVRREINKSRRHFQSFLQNIKIYNKIKSLRLNTNIVKNQLHHASLNCFFIIKNKQISCISLSNCTAEISNAVKNLDFASGILIQKKIYTAYESQGNYIITVKLLQKNSRTTVHAAGIQLMSDQWQQYTTAALNPITSIKQFQILKGPLKNSLFLIYVFFYLPVLMLGILFFYYKSNQITVPISALSQATRKIADGDFNFQIKSSGNDEINQLVRSFKEMAWEIKNNRVKIKSISHLDAWRDVAMRLAHEMKNPLTPLVLALEKIENRFMRANFDAYSELNNSFNLIKHEINNIKNLVAEFSQFSQEVKITPQKKKAGFFEEKFNYLSSYYPDINFKISIKNKETVLEIDLQKLTQVITNLIQNAVDAFKNYKSKNKTIWLKAYAVKENGKKVFIILVEDNGPGISTDSFEEIFKPYYTTKKHGTGLGLSISQQIIHAHNGKLHVESHGNKTSFKIILTVYE
ncbi:MAG TPA: ATP-binding protein [Spirochaetota bacterium]|nr:ATP-binding protein [Spirochaetota bacterium]